MGEFKRFLLRCIVYIVIILLLAGAMYIVHNIL